MLVKIYDSVLGDPSMKPLNSGGSVRKDVMPRSMILYGMAEKMKDVCTNDLHAHLQNCGHNHKHTQINTHIYTTVTRTKTTTSCPYAPMITQN